MPLLVATALGIHFGSQGFASIGVLIIGLVAGVIWLFLEYRGSAASRLVFWLVLLIAVMFLGALSRTTLEWDGHEYRGLEGEVWEVKELTGYVRVLVRLSKFGADVAVHLPDSVDIAPKDTLTFSGTVSKPPEGANPGSFCYRSYLADKGVYGLCEPDWFEVNHCSKNNIGMKVKSFMRHNIIEHIQEPGLVLALVLGDRSMLTENREDNWRQLGISHLIAISGMHIGLLGCMLALMINLLPFRSAVKFIILQTLLLLYVTLVGARASTLRAFLAFLLGSLSALRGHLKDPLHIWAVVGFLLLLGSPSLLYEIGFQLSFLASGGIILWAPVLRFKTRNPLLKWVLGSLVVSVIAQCSLAPLLVIYFGEIALLGPIATLVFLPFVFVLCIGGLVVSLGGGIIGLGSLIDGVMSVLNTVEQALIRRAVVWTPKLSTLDLLLWWAVFVYAGWNLRQPKVNRPRQTYYKVVAAILLVAWVVSLPPQITQPLEITALNVGQGDCYYVRTPLNQHILIDGGGDSVYWQERGRNVGEERVVPYLRARGVESIDLIILSHPHEDHLHGLLAVLENFDVSLVIDNGYPHATPSYDRYLALIAEKEIERLSVGAGDELNLTGGVQLDFLHPIDDAQRLGIDCNNSSLVFVLEYCGVRMLFTGDLEKSGQLDLLERRPEALSADLIKVPHHGSKSAWNDEFYNAVQPFYAIISVGPNSFGHPHPEVLKNLERRGVQIARTDRGPVSCYVWLGLTWLQ